MARRSGSPARVKTVPRFVIYRSSEDGSCRGWPERDAGWLRSPVQWREGLGARLESRQSRGLSFIGARRTAHAEGGLREMRAGSARPFNGAKVWEPGSSQDSPAVCHLSELGGRLMPRVA